MIFTVCAIAEIAVGVVVLVVPGFLSLLLGASLEAQGLLVARMLGVAALALGLTWWKVPGDARLFHGVAPGFLAYNVGVGALFGVAALTATRPVIPWLVAAYHLAAALLGMFRSQGEGRQAVGSKNVAPTR